MIMTWQRLCIDRKIGLKYSTQHKTSYFQTLMWSKKMLQNSGFVHVFSCLRASTSSTYTDNCWELLVYNTIGDYVLQKKMLLLFFCVWNYAIMVKWHDAKVVHFIIPSAIKYGDNVWFMSFCDSIKVLLWN